jgi:integrase
MPSSFPFSEARVKALKPPEADREYHKDTKLPGLQVCVFSTGVKVFYLVKRIDGKPTRVRLGTVEQLSVDTARKAAAKHVGQVAEGKNPQAERRDRLQTPTMADLYQHWMETHAKLHKKAVSCREDAKTYNAYLKPWAARRLHTIRKVDVAALHAKVGRENGPYSANRMLALLRAMYNKAGDIGYTKDNPARGIKRFAEEKRDRFLTAEEFPKFFEALAAEPSETLRDFFLLALLVGARKTNLLNMQWSELDLNAGFWRIPDTKANKPQLVPLIAPVVSILRRRQLSANGTPWVFPGRCKGQPLVYPNVAWKKLCERAGIENLRIHDLRRTLGSWQAMTGASLPIIGAMLGHSQPSTTAIYARLTADPVRDSVTKAADMMLGYGGMKLLAGEPEKGEDHHG